MKYCLILALVFAPALLGQVVQPCPFCEIIQGKLEASIVFRNDKVIAFLDHAPINPGHTLVIPIEHCENLQDTSPEIASEMMTVAQNIGNSFASAGIKSEAFQLHLNSGRMVQRVRHAHLHVYPRYQGDFPGDSVVRLASQRTRAPRPELNETAVKLKRTLELKQVFTEYYEEGLKLQPMAATDAGDPRYNDLFVNNLTDEFRQRYRNHLQKFLGKIKAFDRSALPPGEQLSYDTMVWDCEIELGALEFPRHLLPLNQFNSVHLDIAVWAGGMSAQPFKTVRDYENWLKRLDGFTQWCETAVNRMREGVAKGYVLPKALTSKVVPQLAKLAIGPAETHPFYAPINQMPAGIDRENRQRLSRAYAEIIQRKIIPAYATLYAYLNTEYLAASRPTAGISEVPGGKQYYELQIKAFTTTGMTAQEIHEAGLSEVQRILKEMEAIKTQVGFSGTLREFFADVRSKKALMPYTEPQQVLDHFAAIHKKMQPSLTRLFSLTPKTSFEIRRTEAFREKAAAAEYISGSLKGDRSGIFYVPIPDVAQYHAGRDESLFLHEAIPGHHYQTSIQREDNTLPMFRRMAVHGAYVEGWALYCESLGRELGLYDDPYQEFGMLSAEMHRAIRLVVDTGIHSKGWTREQAITFSLEHEAASENAIISEIERYMAWPGQALGYKIGQLKIRELRSRAEKELGTQFNIREFHRQVLETGSVPLQVLDQKIQHWIAGQKP